MTRASRATDERQDDGGTETRTPHPGAGRSVGGRRSRLEVEAHHNGNEEQSCYVGFEETPTYYYLRSRSIHY
eukprot:scaffold286977_cov31-Tisochrysis_lutea.AAC.4